MGALRCGKSFMILANDIKLPVISKPPPVPKVENESIDEDEDEVKINPFRVPRGNNFTKFLENKEEEKKKSIQDKTTYSRQVKQLPKVIKKDRKLPPVHVPRPRNIDENGLRSKRQPLSEHIHNLRQRRLILYSAHIMREEMKNLDEIIETEETKLRLAEQDMKSSLNKLDNARMDVDQKHIEARQLSRQLVMECHKQRVKINMITSLKSSLELDISEAKEKLTDFKMYHDILKLLSEQRDEAEQKPVDVEETSVKFGMEKHDSKMKTDFSLEASRRASKSKIIAQMSRRKSKYSGKMRRVSSKVGKALRGQTQAEDEEEDVDFDIDKELEPLTYVEVYFESPQHVMDLCTELYYQNITIILKFRQIEDELKETQMALLEASKRKEAKLLKLTEHIKERTEDLNRKKNKLRDVQIKVMLHSAGSNLSTDKETSWENLKKKVNDVYSSILGKSKVRISTQQKLTNIEVKLFELLQQLESAPKEKVEALWQAKIKEKYQKLKELGYKQLRDRRNKLIEESWKNVILAEKQGPTRKLMSRSKVENQKKNHYEIPEKIFSYDDDQAYYFSM